ncbi:phosphatase PAP2 family protein [Winogradskyella undariae]|uniref:phosphatase PAP2 family protein n=1 Tax=Winogradskyella TaxID=286104 RepID=UPI00156B11F3|nr:MULTISPECIES: phosphatase PAP2 family protein [Winogradskyella]NRR91168.1 phosphatase PAP2 family protein [Winogradskyella undariae]QXP79887.1 phosphatase PAP2 family protein [Winogradskyella sp. HaHa_3_26]
MTEVINKITILCLFSLVSLSLFSQTDSTSTISKTGKAWNNLKYDAKITAKGIGHSFTRPLSWKGKDFATLGGVVAGTSLLYLSDKEANRIFYKQGVGAPQVLKDFGWYFGSPQNFFMVSTGIYGFGLLTDNEKVRKTGVLIFSSAITTGIIQSISKTVVGRARPNSGDYNEFEPFSNKPGFHSFPSGHSVLSFTMAHSIAKQFSNIWVKSGIYAIGSIAPISRLWEEAHWLSDVGLGMAISVIVVDSIDNFMTGNNSYSDSKPKTVSWRISAGMSTIGVVGTF